MPKTIRYAFLVFKLSYEANGTWAITFILSYIYENTFYPFIQVFLLAQLLNVFAKLHFVTFGNILWIAEAYIIATFVNILSARFIDTKDEYLFERLNALVEYKIVKKLTQLDPATFEQPGFQSLLTQLSSVKGTIQAQIARSMDFLNVITKFITAAVVVAVTFPIFVPIFLIAAIPMYIAWRRSMKRGWPYYTEKRADVQRITQYITNLLSSDSTSKEATIFQTGSILLLKIATQRAIYFRNMNKAVNPGMYEIIFANLLQLFIFLYTQFLTLSAVLKGTLSIGSFALIFQQSLNLVLSSEEIFKMYASLDMRTKYIETFFEFLNMEKVIKSATTSTVLPTSPMPPFIEFKNVTFRYPKTERDILKHFNMSIQSGEKIALVGENGAGKTTIIKLLLRFYDVSEGELLVNGVNIKELSLEEWHKQVGALFQDFIKYQFTFKENVYYGKLDEKNNEELLKAAIMKSGADKYLDTLPNGIDQVVGKMFDGGIDLSGGQWQKLALARAFFRDAPILILDEPTAAIDAKAEYEIFENVQKLQKDKTVIIISHRFSTVRNADRIVVLNEGRILEEGNHEVLLKKKGLYSELFHLQAKGYQ